VTKTLTRTISLITATVRVHSQCTHRHR